MNSYERKLIILQQDETPGNSAVPLPGPDLKKNTAGEMLPSSKYG